MVPDKRDKATRPFFTFSSNLFSEMTPKARELFHVPKTCYQCQMTLKDPSFSIDAMYLLSTSMRCPPKMANSVIQAREKGREIKIGRGLVLGSPVSPVGSQINVPETLQFHFPFLFEPYKVDLFLLLYMNPCWAFWVGGFLRKRERAEEDLGHCSIHWGTSPTDLASLVPFFYPCS